MRAGAAGSGLGSLLSLLMAFLCDSCVLPLSKAVSGYLDFLRTGSALQEIKEEAAGPFMGN
jgi:hypothetical protein